jgi:hypothetical protein
MVGTESESAQKDGIVALIYNVGKSPHIDRVGVWQGSRILRTMPVRVNAMHYCYDNPIVKSILSLGMLVVGEEIRARIRPHFGKYTTFRQERFNALVRSFVSAIPQDPILNAFTSS